METFTPKTCFIKVDPPTLVIFYKVNENGKIHRRSIPIRDMKESSSVDDIVMDLNKTHHGKYLKKIPEKQLKRLLTKLHENIYSFKKTLDASKNPVVDGNKDLNKLDDTELDKVKEKMSESFEEHRVKPGDKDWKYDLEVDFEENVGNKIESGWDSEESDLEF